MQIRLNHRLITFTLQHIATHKRFRIWVARFRRIKNIQ